MGGDSRQSGSVSPGLGYVSQNSLPCMLPVRMGHRDSELEDRSGAAAHSLHVEWVQGHPALSQFAHAGMYLLAHLVDVGQRPGLQPGLQLPHLAWALQLL